MKILEVKNLRARYNSSGLEVLKDINFYLEKGDFLAVIGSSGSGKSTLIRCINRLIEPYSGNIIFEGENITELSQRKMRKIRSKMGMIFQEFNLIERMTVIENVLSGRLGYTNTWRSLLKNFKKCDIQMALQILYRVGMSDFVEKRVSELSGGQRQRVGIARAMMQCPKLLLVDEPTSSLDPKIAREIMVMIKKMSEEEGIPVICNMHDVVLSLEFTNKIIGLKEGKKIFEESTNRVNKAMINDIYMH